MPITSFLYVSMDVKQYIQERAAQSREYLTTNMVSVEEVL